MLHRYGTPAFRIETYLLEVTTYLNVQASFLSTPTSLTFVIWSDKHEEEYTHAARLLPGDLDMNILSRTDELATQLLAGDFILGIARSDCLFMGAMGSVFTAREINAGVGK